MPGIARVGLDFASTHSNGDTHVLPKYVSGNAKVLINGKPAVVQDSALSCGDKAKGCSNKVLIGGKGVHRLGDAVDSHNGTYSPSACISASSNVIAG
jgi:uncharacterized Zn-binding protein involved in type VI secretion